MINFVKVSCYLGSIRYVQQATPWRLIGSHQMKNALYSYYGLCTYLFITTEELSLL